MAYMPPADKKKKEKKEKKKLVVWTDAVVPEDPGGSFEITALVHGVPAPVFTVAHTLRLRKKLSFLLSGGVVLDM